MKPDVFFGLGMAPKCRAFQVALAREEAAQKERGSLSSEGMPSARATQRGSAAFVAQAQNILSVVVGNDDGRAPQRAPSRLRQTNCPWWVSPEGLMLALFVFWAYVCATILFSAEKFPIKRTATGLFLVVLGMVWVLARLPRVQGARTNLFSVVVLLLILQVFLLSTGEVGRRAEGALETDPALQRRPSLMTPAAMGEDGGGYGLPTRWAAADTVRPYPVCRLMWGGAGAQLTSLELAALAHASYDNRCFPDGWPAVSGCMPDAASNSSIYCHLQNVFGGSPRGLPIPKLEWCSDWETFPRTVVVYFPGADGQKGTRVVAVRGTWLTVDMFIDLYIYSTVQVFQWLNDSVMPVVTILSRETIQKMLTWPMLGGTVVSGLLGELKKNVSNVTRWTESLDEPEAEIVLTGHSLGGAIAQIIASQLALDALAFSSPGTVFISLMFNLSRQRAQRLVNVVPDHDLVPKVDQHYSTTQKIRCTNRDGTAEEGDFSCHKLDNTACEMWRVCGDAPTYRNFSSVCQAFVAPATLGQELLAG